MPINKLGSTDLCISMRLRVVWELTSIDEPRGALPQVETMHRHRSRWSPPGQGLQVSAIPPSQQYSSIYPWSRQGERRERRGAERAGEKMDWEARGRWDDLWHAFSMCTEFSPIFPTRASVCARCASWYMPHRERPNQTFVERQLLECFENGKMHIREMIWRTNRS
jgi:hypothetical protein